MLEIRREQAHTLSLDEAHQSFVLAMMEHLREHFAPELQALDDLALAEEIQSCLARARGYGLSARRDCARWLGLAASLGWSFDLERPWVQALLRNPASSPSARLAAVYERCVQELREAAESVALHKRFGI